MSQFKENFDFQVPYLPAVKTAIAAHLISEAPIEEDMKRNTDLMVLKMDQLRISVRIRRHEYLYKLNYRNEFTIRKSVPSGVETELGKVISGWGTHIFYGFAGKQNYELAAWMLGDLNLFRGWLFKATCKNRGILPGQDVPNGDGTRGQAFTIADLPDDFVIARVPFEMDEIGKRAISDSLTRETMTEDRYEAWARGVPINGLV